MKINVCMLLGLSYSPKMRIVPQIGIASYITNFGHKVTWILSSEELQGIQETTLTDVRVFVVPCKSIKHNDGPIKFINKALLCTFRKMCFVFKKFKKEKYNLLFVRDNVLDALLAIYIKKRYKIPFVFGMSNPIQQNWETHKFYSKHEYPWYFILKIEAYLTMYILHKADLILPISKWLKEDLAKRGIEKSKMMPLPEGIDPNRVPDVAGGGIRKEYKLEDFKVIIYIGTMSKLRHLDVLIHAFSNVRESRKKVKLLMIGEGNDKPNLERLVGELGIKSDVIFTGQVHHHEIPDFIESADIGVSPIPPISFYKLSSPIKLFEYMAASKPVVANEEIPEQNEVIGESKGGVLVKFEYKSFADGIIELLDNPDRAKDMGRKGYEWVIHNRSYEMMASNIEKRYLTLVNKSDLQNK